MESVVKTMALCCAGVSIRLYWRASTEQLNRGVSLEGPETSFAAAG
jgi:hypothetical protein